MSTFDDRDMLNGFIVLLDSKQSTWAHDAEYEHSHGHYDSANISMVQAECYSFAKQSLQLTVQDEVNMDRMTPQSAVDGFIFYMKHLQQRALDARLAYNKDSQPYVYSVFTLIAETYKDIEETAHLLRIHVLSKELITE